MKLEFVIDSEIARERIIRNLRALKLGSVVTVTDPDSRTAQQNRHMWKLLTAISKQLDWKGKHYRPDQWRDYFTQIMTGEVYMPDENGGWIGVGKSSGALSATEHYRLTDAIKAFADRHGVIV